MIVDIPKRVAFLRKIYIFNGLSDEQLTTVAHKLHEEAYKPTEKIIQQGEEKDFLYLIYDGKVSLSRAIGQEDKLIATQVTDDFFGEENIHPPHHFSGKASALEDTLLLLLHRDIISQLCKQIPQLRTNFDVALESRRLTRKLNFKWLRQDEVVYLLARKHTILLWRALIGPMFITVFSLISILMGWTTGMAIMVWTGSFALFFCLLWAIWNRINWGNDYYIVTNQRVVWLEKVIGFYDSRQESPLNAVLRVGIETDVVGRLLDYGNVIVQTFVGNIHLRSVPHHNQAAALIEEYWKRTKESSHKLEEQAIKEALQTRLLSEEQYSVSSSLLDDESQDKEKVTVNGKNNPFKLRFEDLGIITYRKHWFVLLKNVLLPSLIEIGLVVVLILRLLIPSNPILLGLFGNFDQMVFLVFWSLAFIVIFLWWYYQYVDWRNDIFQVTPEQIVDINKKPLSSVDSEVAALDNILSIEYKRIGPLQLLFNYGTVYITVGGGKRMDFEDVHNPALVQEDIDHRRHARITLKEQEQIKSERERLADWLAVYHRNREEFPNQNNAERPDLEAEDNLL